MDRRDSFLRDGKLSLQRGIDRLEGRIGCIEIKMKELEPFITRVRYLNYWFMFINVCLVWLFILYIK